MNTKPSLATTSGLQPSASPFQRPEQKRTFPWVWLVCVILALLSLPTLLTSSEGARGMLGLSLAGVLFFLLKRSPAVGLPAVIAYLSIVGGLRRLLLPIFPWSGTDPLLIVAPIVAVMFLLTTRRNYQPTRLMRLILMLLGLMILEVVNPLQGGLTVGVAGMLFYVTPLFWYFIGRQLGGAATLRRLFQGVVLISLFAAAYGLYQTWFGFTDSEQKWMATVKNAYNALTISDDVTRAFSFFTSASEYSVFLCLGIVVLWAFFLRGRRAALLPIIPLVWALFLETARGPVLATVITCAILWTIQGRTPQAWLPRGLGAMLAAGIILLLTLNHLQSGTYGAKTQALVAHQTEGLLNPLDQTKSSAPGHVSMILGGVLTGIKNPVGLGLGSTTIASQKFGGVSDATEVDISNMFVSLGFIGGLIYIVIVAMILVYAFRYWQTTRTGLSLLILAVLLVGFGGWLNGGHYAISPLIWFCVGALELQRRAVATLATPVRGRPAQVDGPRLLKVAP